MLTKGMHGNEGFFKLAGYFGAAGAVAFALMGGDWLPAGECAI
jgi:hypothetical protein